VVLSAAAYDGGLSWSEEDLMVYDDDNEAVTRYLYGGVDRMRANIATSQAAYAEASKRTARDRSEWAATMSLAQAIKRRRMSQRVELSVD
jgi:hypothetical protein